MRVAHVEFSGWSEQKYPQSTAICIAFGWIEFGAKSPLPACFGVYSFAPRSGGHAAGSALGSSPANGQAGS